VAPITKQIGFKTARLNHQRDNVQEAPVPVILPLDSTSDGIIDGNPSSSVATSGTGMAGVIILVSPGKSHCMSRPLAREHMSQVRLEQQRECTVAEGRRPWL
jgi:hypothetical protein